MKWFLFVSGLLIGSAGAFTGIVYLQQRNLQEGDDQIVFAAKNFYDNNQDAAYGMVIISGTLTGEGLAYPNNTYSVGCEKGPQICTVSSIEQIGPKQIGRLDGPWIYPIVKWDPYEIVASEEPNTFVCAKVTITIERKERTLLWVEEPINQTRPICEHADTKVRKYTLEDSLGWKRLFGKK
jgi:hypothetical protein